MYQFRVQDFNQDFWAVGSHGCKEWDRTLTREDKLIQVTLVSWKTQSFTQAKPEVYQRKAKIQKFDFDLRKR